MKALIVATISDFITAFEINDIKILKSKGYEIYCATNFNEAHIKQLDILDEIGVIKRQVDFKRNPFDKENIRAYKQLKSVIDEEDFKLVHCHTPVGGVLSRIGSKKWRKKGTIVIYTAHGFHFFKGAPLRNWILFYPIEKWLSRCTDVIITINHEDYDRAKKKFHAKHVKYIPGVGVDTAKFSQCLINKDEKREKLGIGKEAFLLLSVGELQERKNQTIVLEALHIMQENGKAGNIVYCVVGEGRLKSTLENMIYKYGLEDHVKMLGYRADVDELCKAADCFIHPSIREGLGIAPLEAMASGLPLITANINGIKDYTEDGVTGYCVDPTNAEEIAKAIEKMMRDKEFRDRCAGNNKEIVKEFDIHQTEKIMREIYEKVTTRTSGGDY